MHPILAELSVGDATVTLRAYATFLVTAGVVAVALATRAAAGAGVPRRRALAGLLVAVGAGLAGARLAAVALDLPVYLDDPGAIVALEARGFALYGGLGAGAAAMAAVVRWWRVPLADVADASIVPVAVGLAVIRVGCFLNGCCAGVATDLPWGVTFPREVEGADALAGLGAVLGIPVRAASVHPTQLYEAAAVLGCAALAMAIRRRSAGPGVATVAFAATFLAFRAFNQLLRPPSPEASLPSPALVGAYAAAACVAAAWLLRTWIRALQAPAVASSPT